MKRGAEKQISKDAAMSDDEAESSEDVGMGFKRAEESVIATRQIRGLPNRATASSPPPPNAFGSAVPPTPPTPSKFGGFSGFSSQSFTFTPPATPPAPVTAHKALPSLSFSTAAPPAVTATASNTAKTFASFLGDSAMSDGRTPTLRTPASFPTAPKVAVTEHSEATPDDPEVKYYSSLRGLNVSLLDALSKTIEKDPFTDVAELLEKYRNLRVNVTKNYQDLSDNSIKSDQGKPKEPKAFSMPAPPSSFTGFGAKHPSTSSTTTGGFTPSLPTPTSTSTPSFTSNGPTSTSEPPKLFPPPTSSPSKSQSNPTTSSTSNVQFGSSSSLSHTSAFSPPTGAFSFSPTTFAGTSDSQPASNLFKSNTSTTSTSPSSAFSFAKPSPFGGFGGFGQTSSGSGSNPISFGFGASFKGVDAKSSITKKNDEAESGAEKSENANSPETTEPTVFSALSPSVHDEEGEGEENEETVYAVKLKAYRLKKSDEKGGPGWAEIGFGVLRLKKDKESDARRMLLRNSSTGKVQINFKFHSGMHPQQSKKTVTFVGHDDGVSQTYTVRLKTEDAAKELKEALDRESASFSSSIRE